MTDLSTITQVMIHPSIGIARVGNSPDQYFLAPEMAGGTLNDPDHFRDAQGCIKRQAPRFRLYGADARGNIIKELTADDGDITWQVNVANKKSAWYDFDLAFDIPAALGVFKGYPPTVSKLRNNTLTGNTRQRLAINGGDLTITGVNTNKDGKDPAFSFNKGTFYSPSGNDTPVYLGELRTDDKGRLIFLGGIGHSFSYSNSPATTFANNETWCDDMSDGPVDAQIKLNDGRTLTALGGWVLTAPPDYAPGVQAFVTGYDLLLQAAIDGGYNMLPATPSFWNDIYPILKRLPLNQWVNATVFFQHGWGSPGDLSNPAMIAQLNNTGEASLALRRSLFMQFRNPDYKVMQAEFLPPIYGDDVQNFKSTDTDPRNFMAILPFQYKFLNQWAEGKFIADTPPPPVIWENLTPAQQAANLDRAGLDETIGGPFHPGCEFTWPMRQPMMYSAPFRLKRRPDAPLDYGPTLDSKQALAPGGPLDGSSPGDVSRWMAVPWQTDTSSCLSGYAGIMGLYIPTFWPVRVPNDVLTKESYDIIMNPGTNSEDKIVAFNKREKWLRGIVYQYGYPPKTYSPYTKGINEFITQWPQVGIVVQMNSPANTPYLPEKIWVETGRSVPPPAATLKAQKMAVEELIQEPLMDEGYLWMNRRKKEETKKND
jgi:L-Lysine epsilon oxidase N-terminal/L-lysine epsilon oxidase C-terminal domain